MTIQASTRPRLLFRVDPIPLESPRGYLCRVASAHRYKSPHWLVQLAGLPAEKVEREDGAASIAHVLRLQPEQWLIMCYRRVGGPQRFEQRSFYGKNVGAYHLNFGRPRVCPACLRERSVWWAVWDLCLVAVCPVHRCLLLDQCPSCRKALNWQRPAVHECRCGLDLRTLTSKTADTDSVAINAAIYRAAEFSPGTAAEQDINRYEFPPELTRLSLGSLLVLLRFLGSVEHQDSPRRKQHASTRTDLNLAVQIGQSAVALLRNWPHSLRAVLRGMVPGNVEDVSSLKFNNVFGSFYFHLFRVLPRNEFGFLHDVFEEFVREDWKGLLRGQHRFFSVSTREKSPWIALPKATSEARTNPKRIKSLVDQGQIEGEFFKLRRGRTQCWIKRASLNQWIATRDAEFSQYIPRRKVERLLGLQYGTLLPVAQAGLMRYAQGSGQALHRRFLFFFREDVMKIKLAFEKHAVPEHQYSKPGEFMALGDALKTYLGCDSGLPAVIKAVVDGNLAPVGYTPRFRGILGYVFPSECLRLYRPVLGDVEIPPQGFLNYTEAASKLSSDTRVIPALVEHGVIRALAGYHPRRSKLVPADEIQRFSNQYVTVSSLAKRFHVTDCWLRRYLKKSSTPMLVIPVGPMQKAIFLQKDVAAALRIPRPGRS